MAGGTRHRLSGCVNFYGELGNGTTTDSLTPVAVKHLSNAVAIAVGDSHSCALLGNGKVKCSGLNEDGELGNGTTATSLTPVTVSGLFTVVHREGRAGLRTATQRLRQGVAYGVEALGHHPPPHPAAALLADDETGVG
jgi:Regulator of chromosome condensation (RCC1) repeat